MLYKTKEKKKDQGERYYVQASPGKWNQADRATFARTEEKAVFGGPEDIQQKIADAEGVPVGAIISESWDEKTYGITITAHSLGSINFFLKYTRLNDAEVRCHIQDAKGLHRETKKEVVKVGYSSYVIDGAWVINCNTLKYDIDKADKLLADGRVEEKAKVTKKKELYSEIPYCNVLSHIERLIESSVEKHWLLKSAYPGKGWRSCMLIRMSIGNNRIQSIWSIPKLAEFVKLIRKGPVYRRQKGWAKPIEIMRKKHLKDHLMTDELRNFIRREWRAIRAAKKKRALR